MARTSAQLLILLNHSTQQPAGVQYGPIVEEVALQKQQATIFGQHDMRPARRDDVLALG
jgi:hypothetical protein